MSTDVDYYKVAKKEKDCNRSINDESRCATNKQSSKRHNARRVILWLLICLGFAIRIFGLFNKQINRWVSTLMEVNTPRTSLIECMIKEATFLFDRGVPIRDQWFLQPPIFIPLFGFLSDKAWNLLFLAMELTTLFSLGRLARMNLIGNFEFESGIPNSSVTSETLEELKDKPEALSLLLETMDTKPLSNKGTLSREQHREVKHLEKLVMLICALNPFSIFSCIGRSLSVFISFTTILSAQFATEGYTVRCFLTLAITCYLSPYSCSTIPPLVLICAKVTKKSYWSILKSGLTVFLLTFLSLMYLSFLVYGGWDFINRIYTSFLSGEDTSPNLGSLWYLNIQIFPEYRLIFNKSFFIGLMLTSLPITLSFCNDPAFAFVILCLLNNLVRFEQTTSDLALCTSLLSLYTTLIYTKTSSHLLLLIIFTYPSVFFIYTAKSIWMFTDSISPNYLFFSNTYLNVFEALIIVFLMRAKKERDWLLYNRAIKAKNIAFVLK